MGLFKSMKSKSKDASAPSSAEQSPRPSSSSTPQKQTYTHQGNVSTSNLSSTSTLTDSKDSKPSPPAAPKRMTSYEVFLHNARLDAERKEAQEHAWKVAAQRRQDSSMSSDPWRGGFGPPVPGRRGGAGGRSVEGWLASNGLRR
jgi:hypothetical protein